MSDSAKGLDNLSAQQKRELLERLMSQKARQPVSVPLSFAQQRLWFLDQLEPGLPLYNISRAFRLKGPLDVVVLERSLTEIARRHETLRTTFRVVNGEPVQVIAPATDWQLPVVDLTEVPEAEREHQAWQLAQAEARRPFDLTTGPLLRVSLLRLGAEDHVLVIIQHHISSDGWSMGVLFRELERLYQGHVSGVPAALPELPIQYRDFAAWQQERLQGEVLAEQVAYWKERLAGATSALDLPTDRPRPILSDHRGGSESFRWGASLSERLRALSRQEGVTLYMTLLAAFQTLLYRYTGQEENVVGSPVANRTRAELEGLIGFFVNTLALRTDLSGDPSFRELLGRVREVCLGAYAHQDVPFERLVEELDPERHLSRNPIFQTMFIVQNAPAQPLRLAGLSVSQMDVDYGIAKFDLTFCMEETEPELAGWLEYNADLLDAETARRMLEHYRTLLEGITADPGQPISRLQLLSEPEKRQILVEWDHTAVTDPADQMVHELFESRAEAQPDCSAVSFAGTEISYRALNQGSNRLAHGLTELGVKPGERVAVLLDTGPSQISALLGVLKAGGAFVCLDWGAPTDRMRQILEDVQPLCLVTEPESLTAHAGLWSWLDQEFRVRVLMPDGEAAQLAPGRYGRSFLEGMGADNPGRRSGPEDPVYITYTSGSTGTPKGIQQSHRSLSQFVQWFGRQFELKAPNRVAQWASVAYDAAYAEIFGVICHGATLCQAPSTTRHDPSELLGWLRRERIALLQTVPSFARQILQAVDAGEGELPDLAHLLVAGEVLPVDFARNWLKRFPGRPRLTNLYGPTEAILATCYPVAAVAPDQRSIPVGHPFDGRQILILDQAGQLCPIGVRGEVYIRSPYLTMGYFRRPADTAASFIQNPLRSDEPDRVYRTGDIARWLPDGNIEFFGRRDHQVKIRGARVELEEIETLLNAGDGVKECVVVARPNGENDLYLVAYVVPDGEGRPMEWMNHLRERLPDYMVPRVYVTLEQFSRTVTGKVDRGRLPEPPDGDMALEDEYMAPRTELERAISQIWQEVLEVDQVGVQDNFFVMGGHSLLATQVVNRMRDELSVDLPLRRVFETPTVAGLAKWVEENRNPSGDGNELLRLMEQVKQLSDDQTRALLQEQPAPPGKGGSRSR